jgi:hypothetical protein
MAKSQQLGKNKRCVYATKNALKKPIKQMARKSKSFIPPEFFYYEEFFDRKINLQFYFSKK